MPWRLSENILLAVAGAVVFIWLRTAGMALIVRLVIIMGSALIGCSVGPEVAAWAGTPLSLTVALVTVTAQNAASIVTDKSLLLDLIRAWRGK